MTRLNLEQYRHPWETGPHWELKREFLEKYEDMFPEDRLLCLAQAYSNVVLMNCSYPDPVMRQISLLSEPLQMRKRFQEPSRSTQENTPKDQGQQRVSEKIKSIFENSGRPFKQVKFCPSSEQASLSSDTTVSHESISQEIGNPCFTNSQNQHMSEQLSNSVFIETNNKNQSTSATSNFEEKGNPSQLNIEERTILSALGLELIQNFAQEIRNFQMKSNSPIQSILNASQKLKIQNKVVFDINLDPKSPNHTPNYIAKFQIDNCMVSTEADFSKKKAKSKSAEAAIDILNKLSKSYILEGNNCDSSTISNSNSSAKNQITDCAGELISGAKKDSNNINVLQNLSDKIVNRTKEKSASVNCEDNKVISTPFVLNRKLFNSSMMDGFVLMDNLALKPITQRNLRNMLLESSSFCHKKCEYKFEDVIGSNTQLTKTYAVVAENIVGTGVASTKDESKLLACENAIEMLRKKYYTLKVKNEYIDGYIITRDQVFEGESFANGALTESNKGCKMLMNMGWTGGGLGTSGISEPIEAQGHSFGRGLGYGKGKNDIQLFKKRIETMMQDYSQTNTLSGLVFSKDFTKEERKEIHRIAAKFHLHTASRGTNDNRFLTVRHKCNVAQILRYLVNHNGSSSRYELVDASEKPFEL